MFKRMETRRQERDSAGKWITTRQEVEDINSEQYKLITGADTLRFFRNLGGTETWTSPDTLTSTSPDGNMRTVRTFK